MALNAATACEDYYQLDVFRRTTARTAKKGTEAERKQALADYLSLAEALAASTLSASTIKDLPPETKASADIIFRPLKRVAAAGGGITDVTKAMDAKIARQSTIIEAACVAASNPVPAANLDLRQP